MNITVPPPEREPPWVQMVRDLVDRANSIGERIHTQVESYRRWVRHMVVVVMAAAFVGQLLGWALVEALKAWLQ